MNYQLKLALRNLLKRKTSSLINVTGLALGMAACLLIAQYLRYEWSYDRQSPHAEHIWRIYNETVADGRVVTRDANTHSAIGPALAADLPEVTAFTRLFNHNENEIVFLQGDQPVQLQGAWMVDPAFLGMFPQDFVAGDAATALTEPYSLILSQSAARRLFGEEEAIGQSLNVPGGYFAGLYTIRGIVADSPPNTHLKFNVLASYATRYAHGHEDNWDNYWEYNYIQLAPDADPTNVRRQLLDYSRQHLANSGLRLDMQPLTDIHLHSDLTYEIEANGNARTVSFLALIALFILGIAWVNYINMTTARSLERAREVGIRKTVGANRRQLIGQFLMEGLVLNLLAAVIALGLVSIAMPAFERLVDRPLHLAQAADGYYWLLVTGVFLVGLLAACAYPAVLLSGFRPLQMLRGEVERGEKGAPLRKALVVVQFSCSTVLIICVIVVAGQLRFLLDHPLGLDLEQVVALELPDFDWDRDTTIHSRVSAFKNELAQLAGVRKLTASSVVPGLGIANVSGSSQGMYWTQRPDQASQETIYFVNSDSAFFRTYGIRLLAGEPFLAANPEARYQQVLINQSTLEMLGFPSPEAAVGQQIAFSNRPENRLTVRGVVADFHIEKLKEPTRPTLYYSMPDLASGYVSLKVETGNLQALLTQLETTWQSFFPDSPFAYHFVDRQFAAQYQSERQLSKVFSLFALLAIFISGMGLFGLAVHATERRTKEIGIRKILGASVAGIVALLSRDFIRLVVIALVIASPLAWYVMQRWLENFAYRIQIDWWVFALAGLVTLLLTLLTVSLQSLKAALGKPVEALKTE